MATKTEGGNKAIQEVNFQIRPHSLSTQEITVLGFLPCSQQTINRDWDAFFNNYSESNAILNPKLVVETFDNSVRL